MKIRLVGAELFQADRQTHGQADRRTERQTDRSKLVVAVRNCANAPSKEYVVSLFAVHCLFQDRRCGKISHTLPPYYNQLIYNLPLFYASLRPLANLHHFLICALSYSV